MCEPDWYRKFLSANPRERLRRDVIVNYAEAVGGQVREYFRRLIPNYWFEDEVIPPSSAGESLGLSSAEELGILLAMSRTVLPVLEASPEYLENCDSSWPRFPSEA